MDIEVDEGAGVSRRVPMDFPGNSYSAKKKPEREKLSKVVEGKVVQRKKPLGKKMLETFIGTDSHSVTEYVIFDVMVPAMKSMMADMVSEGIERLLFGDTRRKGASRLGGSYTSYNKFYTQGSLTANKPVDISRHARATHDFEEIILPSRGDAEEILDRLSDLIDNYGMASVEDLYDLVGITASHTDNRWGWDNLHSASSKRVREGYLLDLPRPKVLD